MGVLIYKDRYQVMDKAPLDFSALKDYYHCVYFDSSGMMKSDVEDITLLAKLRAGMLA